MAVGLSSRKQVWIKCLEKLNYPSSGMMEGSGGTEVPGGFQEEVEPRDKSSSASFHLLQRKSVHTGKCPKATSAQQTSPSFPACTQLLLCISMRDQRCRAGHLRSPQGLYLRAVLLSSRMESPAQPLKSARTLADSQDLHGCDFLPTGLFPGPGWEKG